MSKNFDGPPAVVDAYMDDHWRIWGQTARDKSLIVAHDCDGSPHCCAELRVETTTGTGAEMHLTYEECLALRGLLKISMRKYREDRRG